MSGNRSRGPVQQRQCAGQTAHAYVTCAKITPCRTQAAAENAPPARALGPADATQGLPQTARTERAAIECTCTHRSCVRVHKGRCGEVGAQTCAPVTTRHRSRATARARCERQASHACAHKSRTPTITRRVQTRARRTTAALCGWGLPSTTWAPHGACGWNLTIVFWCVAEKPKAVALTWRRLRH